eukprot:TRINITY_DN5937_c0_g2_i1.p1 TRINITY_DN5937_c0_g2~~TRINITY_DN5937_c0_g2_i1.p1  ORF type:complete len:720 (-),score=99.61 TRINITY_DN5937_c0_g2_i1:71-2230(-)
MIPASINPANPESDLEKWTQEEVRTWFESKEDFKLWTDVFTMRGETLANLTKEGCLRRSPTMGDAIFNIIAKLKTEGLEQAEVIKIMETEVHPLNKVGTWIQLPVTRGLLLSSEPITLFVRQSVVNIWESFEKIVKESIYLTGPPGSGKSSIAYAWCLWKSQQPPFPRIDWVQLSPLSLRVTFERGQMTVRSIDTNVVERQMELIHNSTANIQVIDGIIAEGGQNILHAIMIWRRRTGRICHGVTSLGLYMVPHTITSMGLHPLQLISWTEQEYRDALKSDQFWERVQHLFEPPEVATAMDESVSPSKLAKIDSTQSQNASTTRALQVRNQLLDRKYFFAGGSARCIFGLAFKEVKTVIDAVVNAVNWKDFKNIEDRTNRHKNSLLAVFRTWDGQRTQVCVVSQYAVKCLLNRHKHSFIKWAAKQGEIDQNPAWMGWVFQMDVIATWESNPPTLSLSMSHLKRMDNYAKPMEGMQFLIKTLSKSKEDTKRSKHLQDVIINAGGRVVKKDSLSVITILVGLETKITKKRNFDDEEGSMGPTLHEDYIEKLAANPQLRAYSQAQQYLQHPLEDEEEWPDRSLLEWQQVSELQLPQRAQDNVLSFEGTEQLLGTLEPGFSGWLHPSVWNHGCYDTAFFTPDGTLEIFQITRATTHKFKMIWVLHLVDVMKQANLSVKKLRMIVVVPYAENRFEVAPRMIEYERKLDPIWDGTFHFAVVKPSQ